MPDTKEPWFVLERSEALAGLLLTSRPDVHVHQEHKRDDGVDFWVGIGTGSTVSDMPFVVQVKGTTSSDPSEWMQNVKNIFPGIENRPRYLPACVFVVNVKDNRSSFAWVAEPRVEPDGAKLVFRRDPEFHLLDTAAVTDIVERVRAYYAALPVRYLPA